MRALRLALPGLFGAYNFTLSWVQHPDAATFVKTAPERWEGVQAGAVTVGGAQRADDTNSWLPGRRDGERGGDGERERAFSTFTWCIVCGRGL